MCIRDSTQGTAQWVFDLEPGGIGKLVAMVSAPDTGLAGSCTIPHTTITGGNRAGRSFTYTRFGEIKEISECADGSTFVTTYEYDQFGRQKELTYPAVNGQRLAVGYHYTSLGYLHYLTDDSNDYGVLWQSVEQNAFGEIVRESTRNGVESVGTRNPSTNWLMTK